MPGKYAAETVVWNKEVRNMMNFNNSKRNRIIAAVIVIVIVLAMVVSTIMSALF